LPTDSATTLDDAEVELILSQGSLELEGRLVAASNASFLGAASLDGTTLKCIYKPVRGERPLWDFPDGTLADRERAARLVSQAGGWNVVPPTVLRDGQFGQGMCQRWVETDPDCNLVDVVSADFDEPGWLSVLESEDHVGNPVLLIHRDDDRLRDMAVLDVVINNADRKGGHVLPELAGPLWGCDHGVCFHEETKLRTVLWGWGGEELRAADADNLNRLLTALEGDLDAVLRELLTGSEVSSMRKRVTRRRRTGRMPMPRGSWPAIPWPPF
jgi:uncharacterized repeat protein (TIGR03843 family)